MRIGLVVGTAELGGVNTVTRRLARGLSEIGHDVVLHVIKPLNALPPETDAPYVLEHWDCGSVRRAIPGLRRLLKSDRHDVVIASVSYVNIAVALARPQRCATALVLVEHGLPSSLLRARKRRDRFLPALMRLFYNRADLVVGVSRGVAHDLEQLLGWPVGRVQVLPNPALPDDPPNQALPVPAHLWFEQHDRPIILAASRLAPEKRLGDLIEAFELLRQSIEARLVILGEGTERERLERQVVSSPARADIWLTGYIADPLPYVGSSDVVALSSEHEGLSMVLLEALAAGRRVVATDCPYGPREVLRDGQLGRLVPVSDPSAFAAALVDALRGSPPEPSEVERHLRPYRVTSAVARYQERLTAVVERRRSQTGGRVGSLKAGLEALPVRRVLKWFLRTQVGQSAARRIPMSARLRRRLPWVGRVLLTAPSGERFTYVVAADDAMGYELVWHGLERRERSTVELLAEAMRDASVFWDVGAYAGLYTLLACAVNPEVRVVSFEPVPRHVAMLRENVEANGWNRRVRVIEAAVCDLESPVTLTVVDDDVTASGVEVDRPGRFIEVPTVRLDDVVPPPDVIKIDVEGLEVSALSTGLETIATCRPTIVAECIDREALARLMQLLLPLGYSLHHLGDDGAELITEPFDIVGPYANFAAFAN